MIHQPVLRFLFQPLAFAGAFVSLLCTSGSLQAQASVESLRSDAALLFLATFEDRLDGVGAELSLIHI